MTKRHQSQSTLFYLKLLLLKEKTIIIIVIKMVDAPDLHLFLFSYSTYPITEILLFFYFDALLTNDYLISDKRVCKTRWRKIGLNVTPLQISQEYNDKEYKKNFFWRTYKNCKTQTHTKNIRRISMNNVNNLYQ